MTIDARTVVTGATGLIGKQLLQHLAHPVVLSRRAGGRSGETYPWEPESGPPPAEALRGAEIVFNLAGEPVAEGRWTDEKKRRIVDSRVLGTRNLVAGLAAMDEKPRVLVSASAVGYYGDRGDEKLEEMSTPGQDFLADVCCKWEHEAMEAEKLGIRVVCVRIGVVLARDGGALAKMLTPFKMGVGGPLGSGMQWMPWVHIDDLVGILLHASQKDGLRGPINGVAPEAVTNAEFTKALGHALHRPAFLPLPAFVLRTLFGDMSSVLLASQRVSPRVALTGGYVFQKPELGPALSAVLTSPVQSTAA